MMRLFGDTHIQFMRRRRTFYIVSAAVILFGIVSMIAHGGLRLGIDFAGGRLMEFQLNQALTTAEVRAVLTTAGYPNAEIQRVAGTDRVLVRISETDLGTQAAGAASVSNTIKAALEAAHPGLQVELLREESVGAKIGKEIRGQAFWAILISLALILIYIGIRFEFRFGLGAVAALAHDVVITLGVFSLLNREISMPVVAALLTIAGYSINDTIVVFDRIREQLVRLRREPFKNVLDISINQTLSRTVITAMTTLFASLALLVFGGEVLQNFALAMTVGIVVGTYSSIFVASALVLEIRHRAEGTRGA
jgi:preprotein translocase SecF subunit